MVYVLIKTYPYEFSVVLGVYRNQEAAEVAKVAAIESEGLDGLNEGNEYDIEEHEIQ